MNLLDGKIVTIKYITQEMMNWLEESKIDYIVTPHLERWRYSDGRIHDSLFKKGGPEADGDFRRTGDDIIFEHEEDRMHFQLRWAEEIITDDPKTAGQWIL